VSLVVELQLALDAQLAWESQLTLEPLQLLVSSRLSICRLRTACTDTSKETRNVEVSCYLSPATAFLSQVPQKQLLAADSQLHLDVQLAVDAQLAAELVQLS
jgi:hypothetical protein